MEELVFTVIKRRLTPLMQLAMCLVIGFTGMAIVKLGHFTPGSEYFAALVAVIFFTLMNTVVSIANESYMKYTVPSYYTYIGMVIVLFLSAKLLSGISIWNLWEYRSMIFAISLFYVIISILIRAVRFLYEAAEKGF